MAPEQAQGLETLDHRADVWALAAIAYECIDGHVPFTGINGPSILLEILTKDPKPPSEAVAGQKYPGAADARPRDGAGLQEDAAPSHRRPSARSRTPSGGLRPRGHRTRIGPTCREGDIAQQIDAKLGALMAAAPAPRKPSNASDSFFGEDDALGAGWLHPPAVRPGADSRPPPSIMPIFAAAGIPKAPPSLAAARARRRRRARARCRHRADPGLALRAARAPVGWRARRRPCGKSRRHVTAPAHPRAAVGGRRPRFVPANVKFHLRVRTRACPRRRRPLRRLPPKLRLLPAPSAATAGAAAPAAGSERYDEATSSSLRSPRAPTPWVKKAPSRIVLTRSRPFTRTSNTPTSSRRRRVGA